MALARARHAVVYPARFMLLAATNPCPCGFAGEDDRCGCSEAELSRHRRRLSGPLLDRIDICAGLSRASACSSSGKPLTSSSLARERVRDARERQATRLEAEGISLNAHMDVACMGRHLQLDARAEELIRDAGERGMLSARGQQRVLRVARTIADLRGGRRLRGSDVGAALALRPEAAMGPREPA